MATIITNPTPRQRFQTNTAAVSAHRDLIASRAFELAADFATLQYQTELNTAPPDANGAAARFYKALGAAEFLFTMRNLAESPSPIAPRKDPDNLDHKH